MNVIGKIFYKTLLYTCPVWLLGFYSEYRLGHLENSYSYKIKNFNLIKDSCETLILGNSQMLKGVNPDLLPGIAYNMANVSQNFPIEEAFLKKYLSQVPRLKTVIIGICYTSFGEDLEKSEEAWRFSFYRKYYGIALQNKFDIRDHSNILLYTPYESLKMCLKNFKVDLIKGYLANGWLKMEGKDSAKLTGEWAKYRAALHTNCLGKTNIQKNEKALRNMISLLQAKGIRIIIVSPPVQDNYLKNLNPGWLAINDSIMRSVEKDHGLKIMDYSRSVPAGFNNCFNDVDHLNNVGANRLTLLLGKTIIENR